MTSLTLYQLTEDYVEAARQLSALAEAGEIDHKALADTLDSIRAPLEVKAVNVASYAQHLKYQAEIVNKEIDRLQSYWEQILRQEKALKGYLHDMMVKAGITKIEAVEGAPPFRLAIRKNPPRVVIDNEGEIPWEMKREVTRVEIDKTAIKDAIKAGVSVPGAHIEQSERVEIR